MSEIRLSIALVTCGRPDSLARTLASVRAQDIQPWEIVISDDSASDAAPAARALAERYGCRYVRGPQRGLYANRNAAALAVTGTHVRTMDDDHELPPGHLEACLQAIASDPDAVWVIGEWIPDWGPVEVPVPPPGEVHPRGFTVQPADPARSAALADGSTIFPSSVFKDVGVRYADGFAFGIVYLELGDRLAHLGYRIRVLGSTYIVHHATPSSIEDADATAAARVFTMLCHSFFYRPTMRNRLLTAVEVARVSVRRPRAAARGFRAYRARCSR